MFLLLSLQPKTINRKDLYHFKLPRNSHANLDILMTSFTFGLVDDSTIAESLHITRLCGWWDGQIDGSMDGLNWDGTTKDGNLQRNRCNRVNVILFALKCGTGADLLE